jgi:hypothetical protein
LKTYVAPGPIRLAAAALDGAEEILRGLPLTPEVRELHHRWVALRTVTYGVIIQSVPTLRDEQKTRLVAAVAKLAREIANACERVRK